MINHIFVYYLIDEYHPRNYLSLWLLFSSYLRFILRFYLIVILKAPKCPISHFYSLISINHETLTTPSEIKL